MFFQKAFSYPPISCSKDPRLLFEHSPATAMEDNRAYAIGSHSSLFLARAPVGGVAGARHLRTELPSAHRSRSPGRAGPREGTGVVSPVLWRPDHDGGYRASTLRRHAHHLSEARCRAAQPGKRDRSHWLLGIRSGWRDEDASIRGGESRRACPGRARVVQTRVHRGSVGNPNRDRAGSTKGRVAPYSFKNP